MGEFRLGQTEELFSGTVGLLRDKGFLQAGVFAADATLLEVSPEATTYEKAGVVVREGRIRKGYKLITLKYVGSWSARKPPQEQYGTSVPDPGVCVAALVVGLNEQEGQYLIPLVEQAVRNIGAGKIRMLVVDRGFFDGENLWQIKHTYGIDFLIYSKRNMDVTKELKHNLEEYRRRARSRRAIDTGGMEQAMGGEHGSLRIQRSVVVLDLRGCRPSAADETAAVQEKPPGDNPSHRRSNHYPVPGTTGMYDYPIVFPEVFRAVHAAGSSQTLPETSAD